MLVGWQYIMAVPIVVQQVLPDEEESVDRKSRFVDQLKQ